MLSNLRTDRYAQRMLNVGESLPSLPPKLFLSRVIQALNITESMIMQKQHEYDSDLIPQTLFNLDISDLLREYLTNLSSLYSSKFVSFMICIYQMYRAANIVDFTVAILGYTSRFDESFVDTEVVKTFLDDHFDVDLDVPDDDTLLPKSFDLKGFKDGWTMLKTNPVFPKICTAITFISTIFISSVEKTGFSLALIPELSKTLSNIQINSVDLIDACIESVVWLAQTGYAVLATGSLDPLFYSDQTIREFNNDYSYIDANKSSALNGSLPNMPGFRLKLSSCKKTSEKLLKNTTNSVVRKFLHDKYCNLVNIEDLLAIKDKNSAMRFCPIGFSLSGPAGVGKTSLAKLTMNTALYSMGFTTDERHQITVDPMDKYHTTMTNDVEGIFIDDLANSKSSFISNNQTPAEIVITMFNNVPGQAIKADVEDKGKVSFNFKCGVVTTNKKDLDAHVYSHCPESILRRLYHVCVKIKPQFLKSGTKMLDTDHPLLQTQKVIGEVDIWDIDIETISTTNSGSVVFRPLSVVIGNQTIVCSNLPLKDYLEVVAFLSAKHKVKQMSLLSGSNANAICMCPLHFIPKTSCLCQASDIKGIIFNALWQLGYRPITTYVSRQVFNIVVDHYDDCLRYINLYCPDYIIGMRFLRRLLSKRLEILSHFETKYLYIYSVIFWVFLMLLSYFFPYLLFLFLPLSFYLYFVCRLATQLRYIELMDRASQERTLLTEYRARLYGKYIPRVFYAGSAALVAWLAIKYLHKFSTLRPNASSLDPEEIDKQPGWLGTWWPSTKQEIKVANPPLGMVSNHLINKVVRNLFYVTFTRGDGTISGCCAFFPKKCVVMIPKHVFYVGGDMTGMPSATLDCMVRRNNSPGGCFSFSLAYETCVFYKDMCVAYIPNCPSVADLVDVLPDTIKGSGYCTVVKKTRDMELQTEYVLAEHKEVSHKYMSFFGSEYHTNLNEDGACMSVLVADSKTPSILGFHMAGSNKTNRSASIFISRTKLLECMAELDSKLLNVPGSSDELMPKSTYGLSTIESSLPHPSSHFYQLSKDTDFEILGKTRFRMQCSSTAEKGLLYDSVLRHCNIVDKWKKPQMLPNYVHYNRFIDKIVQPSKQFNPSKLQRAIEDYISPLITQAIRYKGVKRPLTPHESINGIDGDRFISPLNLKTSMGFPVFKSKEKFFTLVYNEEGKIVDRVPDPCVVEEIERLESCYRKGCRGFPVFTACLKDEVKEATSDKVRVFTASPVAFSILVRQYFLPIISFFQHFPLDSEMAVGVNSFGLQWQDLMKHTEKFADEDGGSFGMDYSGYDTRMNSQLSRSAYAIMIQIAKAMGYDPCDLRFMEAMVDDLTHPILDINGTMYQLFHMNCSGNSVTVQVNCIVNSLYIRLAFFDLFPKIEHFREYVAITTYGDDNKGSVHKNYRKFNFLSIQTFLAEHDIHITAPDKKSEGKAFFAEDELDFLKRQSHYIPEINREIGRLDEDSIFKSLCWNLKSKSATPREVAISCIEGAMHEWFAFGKNHYDRRRSELTLVASDFDMEDLPCLSVTFEQRVQMWLDKYRPS